MSANPKAGIPFIPHELDDLPLRPSEFRVLCRISRRSNMGETWCFESVANLSKACRIKDKTVRGILVMLENYGLLERRDTPGMSSAFRIRPANRWLMTPEPDED